MESLVDFGIRSQKYLPGFITDIFTKKVCSVLGRSTRKSDKLRYATTYKVDWKNARKCKNSKTLDECLDKFETLNDLFARQIIPELTKPEKTQDTDLTSPAECYVRTVKANSAFEIKGAKYDLKKLLDRETVPKKYTIYIFRLAPEQYHRFHSPTKSKIKSIKEVGGTYKSVNPILLNLQPILQENYRKIIDFENGIIMVAIGATCVGSVVLTVKKGSKVKHGDDIGFFEFGGSCIALIIPYKLEKKNNSITENEGLLKPGRFVCSYQL